MLPPWLTSLIVGVLFFALSLAMRALVQMVWPTAVPFGFLFPMILLATLLGRWLGGLTCFALGIPLIWYLVRPDLEGAGLQSGNSFPVLILYLFAAGTMLGIAEAWRRSQEALRREQALRAEAETERQRLLAQELGHRIKNLLSIVQAIASQTLDRASVDPGVRRAFDDRLVALARAHELLNSESWKAVQLDQLVAASTSPFENGARFVVDGPSILLPPRKAIAIALALHELATNALKYGALSQAGGRVDISWHHGAGLNLDWVESGGPSVKPPERSGFGTRLLQRNLAIELGGTVTLDYASDGLKCQICAPELAPPSA